uniref:Uncharacterized protein n=1 Tax=Magallana gigas TaxID=29159 RepID=K1PI63_MAGGI
MPSTLVMITKALEANSPILLCCYKGMMGNHEAPRQILEVLQDKAAERLFEAPPTSDIGSSKMSTVALKKCNPSSSILKKTTFSDQLFKLGTNHG